jgi:hypothetical protein
MEPATILKAIPSGHGVLESTVARRLGLPKDETTPLLLKLKEQGDLNYYYSARGRTWFRQGH